MAKTIIYDFNNYKQAKRSLTKSTLIRDQIFASIASLEDVNYNPIVANIVMQLYDAYTIFDTSCLVYEEIINNKGKVYEELSGNSKQQDSTGA